MNKINNELREFIKSEQRRLDEINLHISLGKKMGFDVSELIKMREQRYLRGWRVYL